MMTMDAALNKAWRNVLQPLLAPNNVRVACHRHYAALFHHGSGVKLALKQWKVILTLCHRCHRMRHISSQLEVDVLLKQGPLKGWRDTRRLQQQENNWGGISITKPITETLVFVWWESDWNDPQWKSSSIISCCCFTNSIGQKFQHHWRKIVDDQWGTAASQRARTAYRYPCRCRHSDTAIGRRM